MSKQIQKPLKNIDQTSAEGANLGNLNVTNLTLDGTVSGGIFENITLINSQLINTTISSDQPQQGFFSYLQVDGDVLFNSIYYGNQISYDYQTATFHIEGNNGQFIVDGCSFFGNIEICDNYIRATNDNGDISIYPKDFGSINLYGPQNINITFGNYLLNVSSGKATINAKEVAITSSKGSVLTTSLSQGYNTLNGDIRFNTDTIGLNIITDIISTTGNNYILTTLKPSNLTIGNIIEVSNANLSTNYQVSVSSLYASDLSHSFVVYSSTDISDTIPSGYTNVSLYIEPSSSIILNSKHNVEIFGTNIQQSSSNYYVDSNNTYFYDPNIDICNITTSSLFSSINTFDKGIKFPSEYTNSNVNYSWFGYKSNTDIFTFLTNITESNNVISGNVGNAQFANMTLTNLNLSNISLGNLNISQGNIDLNCGILKNVSEIQACSDTDILKLTADNYISLSGGFVQIPVNNYLYFGDTSYNNSIVSDNTNLTLNGYNGINAFTNNFTISGNLNVLGTLFGASAELDLNKYIIPLGTTQYLPITNIVNSGYPVSNTNGNISITTSIKHYFVVGDSITIQNSDSDPLVDGDYIVNKINSDYSFNISTASNLTTSGSNGQVVSILTRQQGKDVGIQVNYWSSTGNAGLTSGSAGYKTGFFGFQQASESWVFLANATNSGDVMINPTYGNIRANIATLSSLLVSNGNVSVYGNVSSANISNSSIASLSGVRIQNTLEYPFERIVLTSGSITSPGVGKVITMFSCTTPNITSYGTMPSVGIRDGTYRMLVASSMATGSKHLLYFGPGKLITPAPIGTESADIIIFNDASQGVQLIYDSEQGAWLVMSAGVDCC